MKCTYLLILPPLLLPSYIMYTPVIRGEHEDNTEARLNSVVYI
jgi:hypothetical protein